MDREILTTSQEIASVFDSVVSKLPDNPPTHYFGLTSVEVKFDGDTFVGFKVQEIKVKGRMEAYPSSVGS